MTRMLMNAAIVGLLLLIAGLLWSLRTPAFRPENTPAQAPPLALEGLLTRDQLEAALTPIRQRLAALDAAVESQEGKIARVGQLAARGGGKLDKMQMMAALQSEMAARADNGATPEEAVVGTAPRAPRSRMLRRFG